MDKMEIQDRKVYGETINHRRREESPRAIHARRIILEQLYNQYKEDEDKYKEVIEKIERHFNPPANTHLNKYRFREIHQFEGEPFTEFSGRVRNAAKICKFTNEDDEIVSQIIQRCKSSSVKDKALNLKTTPTLKEIIELGTLDESITNQINSIPAGTANVNRIENRSAPNRRHTSSQQHESHKKRSNQQQTRFGQEVMCQYCGYDLPHKTPDEQCPAKGKECTTCGRHNHFAKVCRQNRKYSTHGQSNNRRTTKYQEKQHKVHFVRDRSSSEEHDAWSVLAVSKRVINHVFQTFMPTVLLCMLGSTIKFSIDTGSQVNLIDEHTLQKLKVKPVLRKCMTPLYGYSSNVPIEVIGKLSTKVQNGPNGKYKSETFIVTKGRAGNLLSYETSVSLDILARINSVDATTARYKTTNATDKWKRKYPDVFRNEVGLHKQFEAEIHIDKTVQPRREKLRHVPFHLRGAVEQEIKAMLDQDLIEPVPGPTPWISPIVPVPKRNGSGEIRICSDARAANKAIKRERHITPTTDDITVKLNGAQVLSKLDLRKGYNQIGIAESCRYITAFCTHLGIFQYKRLNFGINTAAEIFQKAIESLISGVEGTINISDDIVVSGRNKQEHDERLNTVLKRLDNAGITVNEVKCVFEVSELDFFGLHISKKGIAIQESKVEAMINAGPPKNNKELRSFLGLFNYCTRFIDNLATIIHPLRALMKTGVKWEWTTQNQEALDLLESKITREAMCYFDPKKRTRLHVDASPDGLAAVFMQYDPMDHDKKMNVVWYISHSLSDVERRYSQVEKEALAVVWACEKLHLYLIGSEFEIVTDNKAVEMIFGNPHSKPKARIERWCLRLLPYNFKVIHKPGCDNVADYLSRNPMSRDALHHHEDMAEKYVNMLVKLATPNALTSTQIAEATKSDNLLQEVKNMLNRKPAKLDAYNSVRYELTQTSGGIILLGNRICIPQSLQSQIIALTHQGHQGIVRTKQLVRNYVWFPNIDKAVEDAIATCPKCQANTNAFQLQPLQMSRLPNGPWSELSIDFYGLLANGKHLLVLIDDFS